MSYCSSATHAERLLKKQRSACKKTENGNRYVNTDVKEECQKYNSSTETVITSKGSLRSNLINITHPQNDSSKPLDKKCGFSLADGAIHINRPHNYRRCAFTLAEVLITLGIIGVVAALTIPAIINNAQNKQLEASLKKNYSVISQALEMYQAKNGDRLTPDIVGTLQFKNIIMPYFKIIADCGMGYNETASCIPVYDRWFTGDPTVKADMYKDYTGKKLGFENGTGYLDDGQFVLLDGSLILLENFSNAKRLYITVDVNGFHKGPNKWGHDIFTTQITKSGKLLPMGAEDTDFSADRYCSVTSNAKPNGIGCTYKALTEKDYFKNLPK